MIANFDFYYDTVSTSVEWGEGNEKYTEVVCIFMSDLTKKPIASCIVYWYHTYIDKGSVVVRNLCVLPEYRNRGTAGAIIENLKTLCVNNNKYLKLWADKSSWMFQWYQKLGFVPGADFDPENKKCTLQWLIYEGKKTN